jgi:hypothetical protein
MTHIVPINQLDVNGRLIPNELPGQSAGALSGIQELAAGDFPSSEDPDSNGDYLIIRKKEGTDVEKLSPCTARLNSGQILACVRRPTRLAFIAMQFGKIALTADADILITDNGNTVRVANLDGRGQTVKIRVDAKLISAQDDKVLALAPGYELVVGKHTLKRSDVRLADGCARRHFKMLEDGKMSVCEICPESVITSSALIATMARQPADKEKRVLADMSKMAAVLNYINGTEGFTVDPKEATQVAHQK